MSKANREYAVSFSSVSAAYPDNNTFAPLNGPAYSPPQRDDHLKPEHHHQLGMAERLRLLLCGERESVVYALCRKMGPLRKV